MHDCRGCVYTVENQWQTDQLQTAEQRSEPRPAASFFRIVVQLEKERQKKNNHTHKQCYIVSVQWSKLSQEIFCEKMSDIYRQINGKLILISCHY